MAQIISIANGKGGVAKTTTSIAFGSSLAGMGYRVLLVDLDSSANLTAGLGTLPEQPLGFSQDLFLSTNARPVRPVKTGYQNLDIIPSGGTSPYLDGKASSFHDSATTLRHALKSLAPNPYHFILLDCPASLGFLAVNALTASDLLIIPTQPEYFSSMALPAMFSMVEKIRQETNPYLKYRILVTLLDLRLKEHHNFLNQFQVRLGDSLYKTRIQIDTHFKESQSQGVPINYAMPAARGALQYRDLAYEVVRDLKLDHIQLELSSERTPVKRDPVAERETSGSAEPRPRDPQVAAPDQQGQGSSSKQGESPLSLVQSVPLTPNGSRKTQQENNGKHCPHLGGADDPKTIQAYPSTWNKCYRAKPAVSPNYNHQGLYCISDQYRSCPMLRETSKASLPSNLRSPLDRSELLQYFKNWVKAKIS